MKKYLPDKNHRYLLWPILVLALLTIGVFLTTSQTQKEQDPRSSAQVFQNPSLFPTAFDEDAPTPTNPAPGKKEESVRATLSLAFSLPGISSQGGNMTPLHKERAVSINFYEPDINSEDRSTKPLYQLQTTALFDDNPASSTYTNFIVRTIDFQVICKEYSVCIPRGKYQIALKTHQALQKVSKTSKGIGGTTYDISTSKNISINFGKLILGDMYPLPFGDNIVDRKDIEVFNSCFGNKLESVECSDKQSADFDDNGVVDSFDYNLLLISFDAIRLQGGNPPSFNQSEKKEIQKQIPTPSPTIAPQSKGGGAVGLIIILVLFIIILVVGGFFVLKNKKIKSLKLPVKKTEVKESSSEGKEYFIKKHPSMNSGQENADGKHVWLTLADDEGIKLGRYHGKEAKEGFAHIKGSLKKENDKEFIEVSQIIWEKKS